MKKNPKLLIILGALGFMLIFGFFWMGMKSSGKSNSESQSNTEHQAFDVAAGDTNNEVLKSIVARQKALQNKNEQQASLIQKLQQENETKTQKSLQEEKLTLQQQITKTKDSLEEKFKKELDDIKSAHHGAQDSDLEYPMGDDGQGQKSKPHMITTVSDLSSGYNGDISGQLLEKAKNKKTSSDLDVPSLPSDISDISTTNKKSIPYYTVPDGSTIANAALLSPIIGEVPVNGQLQAPAFPFKAVLSYKETQNMFAANGIPLPKGIAGTVLQGYSVGSMSLGCARPYVMKVLFVFQDGHFVVFPEDKDGNSSSNNATQVYPKNSIGYLSDAYNNPCITGRYITDAPKVIGSLMALGAGEGVGGAIANAQTQTLTNISQGTTGSVFNGSLGKYAAGLALNEGAKDATDWYKSRINDVFDAIFVPSTLNGQPRKLIFNVTQTIPIDLNKLGRTLHYENKNQMFDTDQSLQ